MIKRGSRLLPAIFLTAASIFSILAPTIGFAAEIADLHFDQEMVLGDIVLELKSLAVKEATFFKVDVYAMGLYLEDESLSVETIFSSNKAKVLVMKFLREIKREKLADSWLRDLQASCESGCDALMAAARDLSKKLQDVKKGQSITYAVFPSHVDVSLDGKAIGTLHGSNASRAILAAVFGERAPRQMREDLLRPF